MKKEIFIVGLFCISIFVTISCTGYISYNLGIKSMYYKFVNVEDRPMWDEPIHAEIDTLKNDTIFINWYSNK